MTLRLSASAGPGGCSVQQWHAGALALPETDLRRLRLWARERVPEHLWDCVKVEADVSDCYVDIVEVRPWDELDARMGSRWT